jgi:hypothetical protein
MSEETTPNTTQAADPVIASTPEPITDSWESQISRQLKSKPKIERTDLKTLEDLPDSASIATDMDLVSTQETEDFLKQMDGGESSSSAEGEKPKKKKESVKETSTKDSFDISDLDLTKDSDPVVEAPKTKKSKEDNIAELRKKAEAYELESKSKEEKLSEYQRKLEEMEATLEKTAFEKSPKFRDKYEQPYNNAINSAMEFAKEMTENPGLAEKALSLKGRERIEFIDDAMGGGAASSQFLSLINKAEEKRESLEGALTDYRATSSMLAKDEELDRAQMNETINRNFDRVAAHLSMKNDFFRMIGDEEHDMAVKSRINEAKEILNGTAPQDKLAVVPFLAAIATDAVDENKRLKAELEKYKNRAAEDAAVQPRISKGSASSDDGESKGKPRSALDSIRSQLRSY